MSAVGASPQPVTSAASPRQPRVWGATAIELHDRYWATRGVQVVRCAGAGEAPSARGPRVFLLLGPDDLALFDLRRVLRKLAWLRPRAMRIRVADRSTTAYDERVEVTTDGEFAGVRRIYHAKTRATMRGAVTNEIRLARLWHESDDARAAWQTVAARAGREQTAGAMTRGRVFFGSDAAQCNQFLRMLLRKWKEPGQVFQDVYQFQPGVWLHESVETGPNLRLIAPLWVGRGNTLHEGDILAGPGVAHDETASAEPAAPIDWDDLALPATRTFGRVPRLGSRRIKRAFDIAFSLCVLAVTLPLYPIIILAIAIEDGWPPFFAHTRQTLGGRDFPCMKFRTMCRNAEAMKAELARRNQADGPQFFIEDDPRLLRTGKFLRKFQIDEWPQFINVLLGHMSVVGPRPSPDKENQYCPAWREARLSVRPGVTGLWQVRRTREPETDFQEWIRYDLHYVQHQSLRFDLWIILQTIRHVIGK